MTETTAPEQDVVDILTTDHREMLELLGRIEGTADGAERRDLADTVIAEVMRHAVAEEMFVYPAIEEHLPDGAAEVEEDKREHQHIVELMKRIEDVDSSEPVFLETVRQLEAELSHHIAEEEAEQFPQLRAHIPREKLVAMGAKVETAKKLAPTRPHPSAPHSGLFHKTVGPGVGMVDRLLDKLSGRNADS
ncbi:hemerythrin domain-containing protein [Georgenia wangjunii]|uniref:hemerythrin domain-containing protein n=1 Tax=Georgenia wangjunii TaxID=3117730 RepID=UPI002F26C706